MAVKADDMCFDYNADDNPDQWASCGKDADDNYVKCAEKDVLCGKLQCKPLPGTEFPQFPIIGNYRGKKLVHYI